MRRKNSILSESGNDSCGQSLRERLPSEFIDSMRVLLGNETDAFLSCYDKKPGAGIRVNTGKLTVKEAVRILPFDLVPVPWAENGFYVDKDAQFSKHPYYFAGLYYIQEPSAMLPAAVLPVRENEVVLDICAAPGGKATELSSRLKGSGLLIANDISPSRGRALLKNLTLWGSANACITSETPRRLWESFGCCFDKILIDAPCSGEGMFRKDPGAISSWERKGPGEYVSLQKEILSYAVMMLKPGGMIVYSTCTFSEKEDEEVIMYILDRYPSLSLVSPELADGLSEILSDRLYKNCIRIYPHLAEGEGQFAALLKKQKEDCSDNGISLLTDEEIAKSRSRIPDPVQKFMERLPKHFLENYRYIQINEQCLFVPPYRLPDKIRYLRTGLLAGTLKNGRFEPSQALAMVLDGDSFDTVLDMESSDGRVMRYLKGETVDLTDSEKDMFSGNGDEDSSPGWVLICTDGYALGWGRMTNDGSGCLSIKNKYYPGWRLQ